MSKNQNQFNKLLRLNMPSAIGLGLMILLVLVISNIYQLDQEVLFYLLGSLLLSGIITLLIQSNLLYRHLKSEQSALDQVIAEAEKEHIENQKKWELSNDREDFFGLWAHQIKTPIAALNVMLQSEHVDITGCKNEIIRIESYVEMALNYLRFDHISNDLSLHPVNLEALVRKSVKKFAPVFIHKHLSVQLQDLDHMILTDEKWFSFILEQLLSNSLKYTTDGGITISASASNDKKQLQLMISDTGIGIHSEDLPRLFEKGFTGYNGRMDKKASGLGLYLSKGVCEKLGHELSITSKEKIGTTATLLLKEDITSRSDLRKD